MRALTPPRALGILFTITCFLFFLLVPRYDLLDDSPAMNIFAPRQGVTVTIPANSSPTPSSSTESPSSSSPPPQTSSSSPPASSAPPQTSSSPVASTTEQISSLTPTSAPTTNTLAATTTPHTSEIQATSVFLTTNQGGQTVTSIVFISDQATSSSTPTQSAGSGTSSGDSGISSSTIIGLSVAGGVALLGIIGFFVWKFTRKGRNEFNDNEEIKWPELNAHDANVPLPTHRTGGSGIDTADVRRNSVGYAPSTAANSTAELYSDPYAVPPLPHLDPNQPYHDDPAGRFYDPYRGPAPNTFDQGGHGEAIPMTQLAGRRSPGPGSAYGGDYGGGRASPVPQGVYGAGDFGGGRASPAPQGAYGAGLGGRASPAPGVAYAAGGRVSPAPQAAYGNYGHGPR